MASYTWEFGAEGSGVHFTIVYDNGEFVVTSLEGSFDLNALWFSDGDGASEGYSLVKSDNSLNMNGSNTVWDDEGNATSEKIVWDDYARLSSTGLGSEGEDKHSFIGDGETKTFSLADFGLADFDPDTYGTLGVRATSVNGDDGFKYVDKEPVVDQGEELNYFTFNFGETLTIEDSDGVTIPEGNNGHYLNQTTDPDFDGESHEDQAEDGVSVVLQSGVDGNGNNISDRTITPDTHPTLEGDGGEPGDDGQVAYVITDPQPYDGIKIISGGDTANALYGGAGGDGQDGGDGGGITITANNNANNNTLTGGDGGAGGNGGSGGHAIYNEGLETVVIEGNQNLTVLGGPAGGGGDGGEGGDVTVLSGNNVQNSELTGGDGGDGGDGGAGSGGGGDSGDGGDGGNVTGAVTSTTTRVDGEDGQDGAPYPATGPIVAAFSHRVDVDASAFTGDLWISGSDFNDTMIFGSGDTVVYATTGDDSYDVNLGAVTVTYTWVDQSNGSTSTDTIAEWGADDIIDVSGIFDGSLTWAGDVGSDPVGINSLGWYEDATDTFVVADVNGDGDADLTVVLLGTGLGLDTGDFLGVA